MREIMISLSRDRILIRCAICGEYVANIALNDLRHRGAVADVDECVCRRR